MTVRENSDNASIVGDWVYEIGADGFGDLNIGLTSSPAVVGSTDVSYDASGNPTLTGKYADGSDYFTLTVNKDGTYTFTVVESTPTEIISDTSALGGSVGGLNGFLYLEDIVDKVAPADLATLNTDIQFSGHDNYVDENDLGVLGEINTNANAIGTKGSGNTSSLPIDTGESITLTFMESDGDATTTSTVLKPVDSIEVTFSGTNGSVISPTDVTFIIHYSNGTTSGATDYNAVAGKVLLDGGLLQISSIDIVNIHASGSFLVKEITTSTVVDLIEPDDVQLEFQVGVVDGDSDSDSYDFSIGIDAKGNLDGTTGDDVIQGTSGDDSIDAGIGVDIVDGQGGADILFGGEGDDILLGGDDADALRGDTGSDTLTGGEGSDVFTYSAGDGGATIALADLITDFEDGTDHISLDGLTFGTSDGQVSFVAADTLSLGGSASDTALIINDGAGYAEVLTVIQNVSVLDMSSADIVVS